MSLVLGYEDVLDLPINNFSGLVTADLNHFTEHDFCVTVTFTPNFKGNSESKKEEEPPTHCIWGRPGKHLGLFYDGLNNVYNFGWWEADEFKFIRSDHFDAVEEKTTISIVKNCGNKTFKMYVNGNIQSEGTYDNINSYVDMPIFLGVANEHEPAFPHQNKFTGEYFRFSINNTYKLDETLNKSTLVYLDFEPENTTYYSVYDISKNGNRARINHSTYKAV